MFDLNDFMNENNEDHNKKWPYVPDHLYRVLIIVGFGSIQTNALINLMKEQDIDNPIDKNHLNA